MVYTRRPDSAAEARRLQPSVLRSAKALAERRRSASTARRPPSPRREAGLRSNSDDCASTTARLGLVRRAHASALLTSTTRITRTEVDAIVSLRPPSCFALRRRAPKSAGDRRYPPHRADREERSTNLS